jgi:hypothetical protein
MQERPLLTAAELAFIRQLQDPTADTEKPDQSALLVDAGEQIGELLSQCAANEQLSIHAHIANQHLTFDLHLAHDEQNEPRLQLGAPQIFDEGAVNRAWRSPLAQPLPLQHPDTRPSHLWVHQLSMNGALVEQRARRRPPAHFRLMLPLAEQPAISLEGELVRKTDEGLFAYQVHTLDPDDDEHLRQFLYQQHRRYEQQLQR